MAILITGGAGYIGSVTAQQFVERGEDVVVLDNLCRGHRAAAPSESTFYEGDVGDQKLVSEIVARHEVSACIHFAAFANVGESVADPQLYYSNNTAQVLALLNALIANNVTHIVFSSTCATYGEPQYMPLDEQHPQWPTSPYGWSKLMVERMLSDFDRAGLLKFMALRYFNAAGAAETRGEDHDPETHLIPIVMQAAAGQRDTISLFGTDYDTPDGTAVRDYIHIEDLAEAHVLALEALRKTEKSDYINLGTGKGNSVQEVIEAAKKVTGKDIKVEKCARRAGDPSHLIANADKAKVLLGWQPKYTEIETIIDTAWKWHQAHPKGYDD